MIELENGSRFDLANLAETQELVDPRIVLKKLDQELVEQGVLKKLVWIILKPRKSISLQFTMSSFEIL